MLNFSDQPKRSTTKPLILQAKLNRRLKQLAGWGKGCSVAFSAVLHSKRCIFGWLWTIFQLANDFFVLKGVRLSRLDQWFKNYQRKTCLKWSSRLLLRLLLTAAILDLSAKSRSRPKRSKFCFKNWQAFQNFYIEKLFLEKWQSLAAKFYQKSKILQKNWSPDRKRKQNQPGGEI